MHGLDRARCRLVALQTSNAGAPVWQLSLRLSLSVLLRSAGQTFLYLLIEASNAGVLEIQTHVVISRIEGPRFRCICFVPEAHIATVSNITRESWSTRESVDDSARSAELTKAT